MIVSLSVIINSLSTKSVNETDHATLLCNTCNLGNLQAGHLQDMNADAAGIIYEVRVYSLEAPTLGEVLHARQIKAAHCLTSVQFSPTSEHLLLAYGRSEVTTSFLSLRCFLCPSAYQYGGKGHSTGVVHHGHCSQGCLLQLLSVPMCICDLHMTLDP